MFALALVCVCGLAVRSACASPPVEALQMAWDDCATTPSANHDNPFACANNLGSGSLYCSFSTAQPIDQVVGLELVVDVQSSQPTLPDYWRLGPIPDCRHDLLTASLDFTLTTDCADPSFSSALLQDYIVGQPRGLTSQARIKATAFVPSPETRSFANDTSYLAIRLVLSYDRTQNIGACAGCTFSTCLVFNSVLVRRLAGAAGGDITLSQPGPGNSNWATWRLADTGVSCAMVPVRNLTWGRIKTLYH